MVDSGLGVSRSVNARPWERYLNNVTFTGKKTEKIILMPFGICELPYLMYAFYRRMMSNNNLNAVVCFLYCTLRDFLSPKNLN